MIIINHTFIRISRIIFSNLIRISYSIHNLFRNSFFIIH